MTSVTLNNYFKRNQTKKETGPLQVKMQDDIEVHPGYFVRKKLYDKLFEHQKIGLKWLFSIHEQNRGCVLADDMGLGKTLQTIALLSTLFRYNRVKHVLIIAPTTLLINWKAEFKRWADYEMFISVIDGSVLPNKRLQMIDSVKATEGVLMMTYNLARILQDELCKLRGREFKWDYVILDEAHKIKNQSKTTRELNKIQSHLRLAITGTPVQNNLSELWSIFNFAMQGSLLGSYATFKRTYEKPIESGRKKDATVREKVLGSKIAKSLRKIYEPYLLRRTKEEVFGMATNITNEIALDGAGNEPIRNQLTMKKMPPKYDWCVWIRMNKTQIRLYEDFLQSDEVKAILANPTTCKSPLVQLNVLKKICDHPRLLTKNTFEKLIYNNEEVDLEKLSTVHGIPVTRLLEESAKLSALQELVKMLVAEKRKILLFSTSTKMLDIIEKVLDTNRIRFCRLDGQITSNDQRERIVQGFQKDPTIQLMTLTVQVGGVGLTLTEATRVIIFMPNWNPGTDAQAVDRAYRIGQKNPNVIVYRLMTCQTVEEKIYSRQVYKDSLTKQTIGKENDPARYFTSTDLYKLFETGDFSKSKVCDEFNEIHGSLEEKLMLEAQESHQLGLTEEQQAVLAHKEKIKNMIPEIYDISEHSLVFSKTIEKLNTSGADFAYLENEVKIAKELILRESLMAKGSSETEVNKVKQRLLTQQYGTEFLPLGKQFNQYREDRNKFEFRRPKPKTPIKVLSLDDEIQFIDTDRNTLLPSLNRPSSASSSSSSLVRPANSSSMYRALSSSSSSSSLHKQTSSSSINDEISSSSSQVKPTISSSSLNRPSFNRTNSSKTDQQLTNKIDTNSSSAATSNGTLIKNIQNKSPVILNDSDDSSDEISNNMKSSELSSQSQLTDDSSYDESYRSAQNQMTDDSSDEDLNSTRFYNNSKQQATNDNQNMSFNTGSIMPSPIKIQSTRSPLKRAPDLVDLSFNMNNLSVMSVEEQQNRSVENNDMSYVMDNFENSIRLDKSSTEKNNKKKDNSIIVLD